jgi:hypothetical protein
MSASLGIPVAVLPAPVLVAVLVLVLVPGGNAGLGAVLGELSPLCANADENEVTIAIPKKTLPDKVVKNFIVRGFCFEQPIPVKLCFALAGPVEPASWQILLKPLKRYHVPGVQRSEMWQAPSWRAVALAKEAARRPLSLRDPRSPLQRFTLQRFNALTFQPSAPQSALIRPRNPEAARSGACAFMTRANNSGPVQRCAASCGHAATHAGSGEDNSPFASQRSQFAALSGAT